MQDPVQPGLEVRARSVLVEGTERLGDRLLDQVLGVAGVTGVTQGSGVEPVQVGQYLGLETRPALRVGELLADRRPVLVAWIPLIDALAERRVTRGLLGLG